MSGYYVYILECSDRTLYTGWARDVGKRVREHNSGKSGAKYTKSRRPVKLVHVEKAASLSDALKREARIKGLSREEKLIMINKGGRPGKA
jgi:putative endonuclease